MKSKTAERLFIPINCEFVRMAKLDEAVYKNRKILPYHKRVISQKESDSSFNPKKVVSTAIDAISFIAKAAHSISAERRDRLKPAPNEEVRSLCDLEPI